MSDPPGPLRDPGSDLDSRAPLLATISAGTRFARFHDGRFSALYFGRTGTYRFDDPHKNFGVLYAGFDEFCEFIETFGHETGIRLLTRSKLEERHLSYLTVDSSLTLVDLASSGGLARVGADARLFSGSYEVAQRWSAALRNLRSNPDGLLYPACHDPSRKACALFENSALKFEVSDEGALSEHRNAILLNRLLDHYDFGLV